MDVSFSIDGGELLLMEGTSLVQRLVPNYGSRNRDQVAIRFRENWEANWGTPELDGSKCPQMGGNVRRTPPLGVYGKSHLYSNGILTGMRFSARRTLEVCAHIEYNCSRNEYGVWAGGPSIR